MAPVFTNYGYYPQTEWLKQRGVGNPGANLNTHRRQMIHQEVRQCLERCGNPGKSDYNRKDKQQADFK